MSKRGYRVPIYEVNDDGDPLILRGAVLWVWGATKKDAEQAGYDAVVMVENYVNGVISYDFGDPVKL